MSSNGRRAASGRGRPGGIGYRLNFFEPLSALLATRPSFVPDDAVLAANRALVSVGVIVWLPHIPNFSISQWRIDQPVAEAAHRRIRVH